jgi:hypothetical protein
MSHTVLVTKFVLCLACAGVVSASAQVAHQPEVLLPIDSLLNSDVVLARIGPAHVTVREFMATSIFGPAFLKRQPNTRQRTLACMINEKLLATGMDGRKVDPRVQSNLEALEGDFATEELFREDVLAKINVTAEEEAEAVRQQKTEISLRWLYRSGESEAAALSRSLRGGVSFDTLFAHEVGGSGVTRDDRQLTTTLFGLRGKNPAMADLAQRISEGRPSDPVKTPDGFYVIQVDSIDRSMLMTETAEAQMRSDVRRALTKMKADSLSSVYVRRQMLDADPVIQRPVFEILRAYLGSRVLSPERFESYGLAKNLERATSDYTDIDRYGGRTLVKLRKGTIPLAEFLAWFRLREANVKFPANSSQAFFLSVEDIVWRMVRDRLLVKRALVRGLQHRPSVTSQLRWWRDKLLFQTAMDSIKKTIDWSDSTLQQYYAAHPRSFRDTTGNLRPFVLAKDDVLREWYDVEVRARVFRRLTQLRERIPVAINENALNAIPVDVENDPRAIEVYGVKKGGTFPHPAFPTIDTFWESWQ